MIVIGLTQQVNTDAELTALTGMTEQQIVWHNGQNAAFMFFSNKSGGDLTPDVRGGYWVKDTIEGLTLEQYKEMRYKEIDTRTAEIITQGFTYQNKVFSLSQNAQINILAINETREDPALSYPIIYNTIDDLDSYSVTDATDLHNMYLTALGTKKGVVDSGTALKDSVRIAVNETEVELIIDNR